MDRRKFVKMGCIGIAALGSGIGTGSLLKSENKSVSKFSVYAFLPADNQLILNCLKLFRHRISNSTFNNLIEKKNPAGIVNKKFSIDANDNFYLTERYYDIRLIKLAQKVNGDIFVSDDSKLILTPSIDYEHELMDFRDLLTKKQGSYLLSIELKEKNFLSGFMASKYRYVKIENNSGLFDKVSLTGSYSSVLVPGRIGKTEIMIRDGMVIIKSSPCRHKLCRLMSQLPGNNMIACVPNQVIIKVS